MSDLEQAYRRWLRWYPRSFRAEYEAEVLELLMDGATDGRRQPGLMECLDVTGSALRVRVRPRFARSERSAFVAMRVLLLGAVVEVATVITLIVTRDFVQANARDHDPGFTLRQWHDAAPRMEHNIVGGFVAIGFWLLLAWAFGQGKRWPRVALPMFLLVNVYGLLDGALHDTAVAASRPALLAAVVLCLVQVAAVIVVFRARRVAPIFS